MASEMATRRIQFEDWHHEHCNTDYCEKAYCKMHRIIYWLCQDSSYEPQVNWFGGGGDCLDCIRESRFKRLGLESQESKLAS